jgi:hypothetical protein
MRALLRIVERDLAQAEVRDLYPDGQYGFLYNAGLQLATMLLRLEGLRVGEAGHHRETLRKVRDLVPEEIRRWIDELDHARRKRNALTYSDTGLVSESDVAELRDTVTELYAWVRNRVASCLLDDPR